MKKLYQLVTEFALAAATVVGVHAQEWVGTLTSAPYECWQALALSADGSKMWAVYADGSSSAIYSSNDAGRSWVSNSTPNMYWLSISSSADGQRLFAIAVGAACISTNGGASWQTNDAPGAQLGNGIISGNGSNLVSAEYNGPIYVSTNAGTSWAATAVSANSGWALTTSGDGTTIAAISGGGSVFVSADGGSTWVSNSLPPVYPSSIACSADGNRLAVLAKAGVYLSTNKGTNWILSGLPTGSWQTISSSADGQTLACVGRDYNVGGTYDWVSGQVVISTNGGSSWITAACPGQQWYRVAIAADGKTVLGAGNGGLIYVIRPTSETWEPMSPPRSGWSRLACSANGSNVIAVGNPGIYVSEDSGASWSPTSIPVYAWNGVACSADGAKIVAVAGSGQILSSSDAGLTWTSNQVPALTWWMAACSGDGTRIVACPKPGGLYMTTDFGTTWFSNNVPAHNWSYVACSTDGTKFFALGDNLLYVSLDGCAVWTLGSLPPVPASWWGTLGCFGGGSNLVLSANDSKSGGIWISRDAGTSWTPTTAPAQQYWALASSADGQQLAATVICSDLNHSGQVYTSSDGGLTWNGTDAFTAGVLVGLGISADGNRLIAAGSGMFGLRRTPAPTLRIDRIGNRAQIGWTIPSTQLTVEQTIDLTSGDWTPVSIAPTVDITNLLYSVNVPLAGAGSFYRLKGQ